jgi:8-oxo-dGTP pyrophosphatase MutT (NUDIX family)
VAIFELPAVIDRLRARSTPDGPTDIANAAVATVLRAGGDGAESLLIQRAHRVGDPWSGHMAFPGGKREPTDLTSRDTAVRETHEEVGLHLSPSAFVARLDDVTAPARDFRVAHFVFALEGPESPLVTSAEVAATLWVPIRLFARPSLSGQEIPHRLQLGDVVVWGMTYRMMQHVLDAVQADR